jgi:hypothetical protein
MGNGMATSPGSTPRPPRSCRSTICREPHALATTPDARWLYVPCRDGRYWVVDGLTGTVTKQIKTGGRPHNTQISTDGRWAFLSPMGGTHDAFIVDIAAGHQVSGRIRFGGSLRPSTLSADNAICSSRSMA